MRGGFGTIAVLLAGLGARPGTSQALVWEQALDPEQDVRVARVLMRDPALGPSALVVDSRQRLLRLGSPAPIPATPDDGRTVWIASARGARLARSTFRREGEGWTTSFASVDVAHPSDPAIEIRLAGLWEWLLDEEGHSVVAVRRLGPQGRFEVRALDGEGQERSAVQIEEPVADFTLSADGSRLAARVPGAVQLHDLVGGDAPAKLPAAGEVFLSANGALAALTLPAGVRFFEGASELASHGSDSPPREVVLVGRWAVVIESSRVVLTELGTAPRSTVIDPELPEGAGLRSVDLALIDGRPRIAVGVLGSSPQGPRAWLQVLDLGAGGTWRRWEPFATEAAYARGPIVRLFDDGRRVLAQRRDALRFTGEL